MNVRQLREQLSNYNEECEVCVEDWSIGSLLPIEAVRGEVEKESGTFLVRLDIQGGKCN